MILCVHLPRFELLVAAAGREALLEQALTGTALALAPTFGARATERGSRRAGAGSGRVGEVTGAAEARGVFAGMMLGEALARCPGLVLVPPDPPAVAERWEGTLRALEAVGAEVEPARAGLAYFDAGPLRALHGSDAATIDATRRACRGAAGGTGALQGTGTLEGTGTLQGTGTLEGTGTLQGTGTLEGTGRPPRIGGAPTRFCALAAALAVRSRRPFLLEDARARRWLAGRPVGLLAHREQTAALVEPLTRLGVRTLGELARLGRAALADRFGEPGALAHGLASGEDGPLRPRRIEDLVAESMEVADASSGAALKRVLGVLVDRLLARPERRGRSLRAVVLSARLATGGGWREHVVFRQAMSDAERIRLALSLRLSALPAPAASLRLSVERFGPAASDQGTLLDRDRALRAARLREAVAQVRAVAGRDGALRAVCVDPDSRVPERRMAFAPIPE